MGDPGARVGACPSPTGKRILSLFRGPFAICSPWWGLFATFFPLWGAFGYFFSMWGVFFVLMGGLFGLAPPPPTEISAAAHGYRYGIATH